ncbi:vacuolar sorting protein VPS33/slp1 [Linnemannia gamsii]|uniref:Vacuolar sorting protein VPS33/slp1 n=1 Tax=Linnemannia gamsii TaxID=64522 RepID=A0A9P6UQY9_9FUNG|nr:vacuolar sorting protein VPS33/slp1 [Linnemannia gamsii]
MNQPISITDTLKRRFLESIDNVKVEPGRYKYVIVDARAAQIMASAGCHMADVLAREGTMYLENLESRRAPSANVEAIYFAMPTEDSVRRIIRDFKVNQNATYSAAHLFFLAAMDDKLFDHFRASTDPKYIKSLKELFMDFNAVESRVFTLGGDRQAFFNLYSPQHRQEKQHREINTISQQLISVCASLQLNPIVSYHRCADSSMQISKGIAMTLQTELDEYYKGQPRVGRKHPHLMIIDRAVDPITPILHDFYYQSMVTDMLPVKDGNKYDYQSFGQDGQPCEKTAMLDETDKTFTKIRHSHITDCSKYLKENVSTFVAEAKAAPTSGNALDAIREQMAKLPQFQETKEKYTLHMNIVDELFKLTGQNRLVDISRLEQSLATGQHADGEIPLSFDPEVTTFMDDYRVKMADRIRLLTLYFITQSAPHDVRNNFFQLSRCDYNLRESATNIEYLGVKLDVAAPPPVKKSWYSDLLKKKPVEEDEPEYDLPRYVPTVKTIIDGVVNGNLDRELYPYTLGPDQLEDIQAPKTVRSLRSAQPTFHHKGRRNEPQGRLIVFIAGGMTYNEIRVAYESAAQHNWDVLIGSTHIITPPSFMEDLRVLKNPPPPPPARPRSPSPPPQPAAKSTGALASVKNVFGGGSNNSNAPKPVPKPVSQGSGQQQQQQQPLPVRPTSQLQQQQHSSDSKYKDKIKGFWNEFK